MAKAPGLPCPHLCVVIENILNPIHNYTMILKTSTSTETDIKHQQLLSQIMLQTSISLLDHVNVKESNSVLCQNCGEGEVAFHLAKMVGKNGKVMGIDASRENIQTAQQISQIKNIGNATFSTLDKYRIGNGQPFDLIHCQIPLIHFSEPENFVGEMRNQLKPGGVALFEIVDFSGFNSIPKNFAFERFLDLYAANLQLQWGKGPISAKLNQLLSQFGFHQLQQRYVAPAFLKGAFKHLPSLTLECIQEELLSLKLSSQDELQVLLYELKAFEQKSYSMISLPGIHQIWGYKA